VTSLKYPQNLICWQNVTGADLVRCAGHCTDLVAAFRRRRVRACSYRVISLEGGEAAMQETGRRLAASVINKARS